MVQKTVCCLARLRYLGDELSTKSEMHLFRALPSGEEAEAITLDKESPSKGTRTSILIFILIALAPGLAEGYLVRSPNRRTELPGLSIPFTYSYETHLFDGMITRMSKNNEGLPAQLPLEQPQGSKEIPFYECSSHTTAPHKKPREKNLRSALVLSLERAKQLSKREKGVWLTFVSTLRHLGLKPPKPKGIHTRR
ncbi:hypothetical protein CLAIMM_08202 [Cladophialophora immunda]|nr:hypothetical protein CLAIMM_08202 [Cladophialophora immunda]